VLAATPHLETLFLHHRDRSGTLSLRATRALYPLETHKNLICVRTFRLSRHNHMHTRFVIQTSLGESTLMPLITQQTGAGAVYYEGARHEDRVVPQAVRDMAARDSSERERARSRSGHRDRSAERRSRRREGESERDHRHRRRRDRHRRDAGDDEILVERTAPHPSMGNALGIHPGSHYPGQGLYATAAPPVAGGVHPNDPYQSTSRVGGAPSTGHGFPPAIATTGSVSGSRYRDAPLSAGPETSSRAPRTDPNARYADPVSGPSTTPPGHLLASWAAPDLSNPSLNSLGLSAPRQPDGGPNLHAFPAIPMRLTAARDSVSSWGTEDSGPTQGDLFSTLRPLAPAPADGGPPASDLLPRQDGQLLGVVSVNTPLSPTHAHCSAGSLKPNRHPATPACTGTNTAAPHRRRRHPPALPPLAPFALSQYLTDIGRLQPRGSTVVFA
jgi:hypothetical protein